MDLSIAGILLLDGATSGAVYALLALALVLVFAVTRVIFIPQGEFVAYGALTLALLQLGKVPGTVWLLLVMALIAALLDAANSLRRGWPLQRMLRDALKSLAIPLLVFGVTLWAAPQKLPLLVQSLLTLAIVTPLGPLVYRLAYQRDGKLALHDGKREVWSSGTGGRP
jgi:branched-chain amino acid transport system permease protein